MSFNYIKYPPPPIYMTSPVATPLHFWFSTGGPNFRRTDVEHPQSTVLEVNPYRLTSSSKNGKMAHFDGVDIIGEWLISNIVSVLMCWPEGGIVIAQSQLYMQQRPADQSRSEAFSAHPVY